jgi:hypothetical protein
MARLAFMIHCLLNIWPKRRTEKKIMHKKKAYIIITKQEIKEIVRDLEK